jgi:hypothetical protein
LAKAARVSFSPRPKGRGYVCGNGLGNCWWQLIMEIVLYYLKKNFVKNDYLLHPLPHPLIICRFAKSFEDLPRHLGICQAI